MSAPAIRIRDAVVRQVARRHGIASHLIYAPTRRVAVVRARHEAMRETYQMCRTSAAEVARLFGCNHPTVLYALGRLSKKPSRAVQA